MLDEIKEEIVYSSNTIEQQEQGIYKDYSEKDFSFKREIIFDNISKHFYEKDFNHLSPEEKIKVLKIIVCREDEEEYKEAYIKTNDEEELIKLGNACGSVLESPQELNSHNIRIFFITKNMSIYTDNTGMIFDEQISKQLNNKQYEHFKRELTQKYIDEWGIDNTKAQQKTNKYFENIFDKNEISKEIGMKELTKKVKLVCDLSKEEPKSRDELKEVGYRQLEKKGLIVFSDKEEKLVMYIDARYYSKLKKLFPDSKSYIAFYDSFPDYQGGKALLLYSNNVAKALIFAIIDDKDNKIMLKK